MAKANESNGGLPPGLVDVLFKRAEELQEMYDECISARKANRESLRNLAAQGLLSKEDEEALNDLYPPRSKKEAAAA